MNHERIIKNVMDRDIPDTADTGEAIREVARMLNRLAGIVDGAAKAEDALCLAHYHKTVRGYVIRLIEDCPSIIRHVIQFSESLKIRGSANGNEPSDRDDRSASRGRKSPGGGRKNGDADSR